MDVGRYRQAIIWTISVSEKVGNDTFTSISEKQRQQNGIPKGKILPQVLACIGVNLILVILGMAQTFTTVAMEQLTTANETLGELRLTNEQASWIGSSFFIVVPIGCLLAGFVVERFGRKRSMMAITIPFVAGWIINWKAPSFAWLMISQCIMGLGAGFLEAPACMYLGESTQPHLRGVFTSLVGVSTSLGKVTETMLGANINKWRQVSFISVTLAILPFFSLLLLPESPLWLLANDKEKEAEKSLMWLRGTKNPDDIAAEISVMKSSLLSRKKLQGTSSTNFAAFTKERTFFPFSVVAILFFLSQFTGINVVMVYSITILEDLEVPLDKYIGTAILNIAVLCGNVLSVLLMRFGRKKIALYCYIGTALTLLGVAAYDLFIKIGFNKLGWLPFIILLLYNVIVTAGPDNIPWVLLGEAIPPEGREIACGCCAAIYYITSFAFIKVYVYLLYVMSPAQVFWIYGTLSVIATLIVAGIIPETHNRTPDEITDHFLPII